MTDSPPQVAGVAFALSIPWLLFALPAGALADRVDRRRAMVVANTARASLLAVLAMTVVADVASIWLLYVIAFCVGVSETVYDTSAQSILPQIVPRPLLTRANGRLFAAELTANEFVGPPLGGLLVAAGVAAAFVTPAGLWAVAVGILLLVPGTFRVHRDGPSSMRRDIAEGLRYLWGHKVLRTLAAMVGVSNFASNAIWAVLVLYAVGPGSAMGLSEPAYGLLLSAVAAGGLVGFLVAERVERRLGRAWALRVTVLGSAAYVAVPAVTDNPFVVCAVFFAGGFTVAVWNVVTVSLRQRIVPDRLLGRVNSGYRLVAWGTVPLGAAAGGLLGQAAGLRAVFAVMGVLVLCGAAGLFVVTDRNIDAAERDAPE
jgi:MFS family permease